MRVYVLEHADKDDMDDKYARGVYVTREGAIAALPLYAHSEYCCSVKERDVESGQSVPKSVPTAPDEAAADPSPTPGSDPG